MVDFSKPNQVPEWADTGVIVEPSEAKKDSGWVAPELPPDTFFNWWQNLTGNWMKWFNERFFDNGAPEDFQIKSPQGPADGGDLSLEGGDSVAASGGNVNATGGAGVAIGGSFSGRGGEAGNGGSASIRGGVGSVTAGGDASVVGGIGVSGGNVSVTAGFATADNDGSTASVSAGSSFGNDRDGGTTTISSGASTGDGSSNVLIRAVDGGQGAGALARLPEDYAIYDGSSQRISHLRRTEFEHEDNTRSPVRIVPVAGPPSAPQDGELAVDSNSGDKLRYYDGVNWEYISRKRAAIVTTENRVSGTFTIGQLVIPANTLRVGDVLRFTYGGRFETAAASSYFFDLRINGASFGLAPAFDSTAASPQDFSWSLRIDITIRTIGAGGTFAYTSIAPGAQLFNETITEDGESINTTIANTFSIFTDSSSQNNSAMMIGNVEIL